MLLLHGCIVGGSKRRTYPFSGGACSIPGKLGFRSLPDTEMREYVAEDVVSVNCAGDGTQMMEGLSDIDRYEVGWEVCC